MTTLKLYSYWRSSAAYRVRIGLNIKGLKYETVPVNLLKGEQQGEAYRAVNPQGAVPTLVTGNHRLTQSLSILEYLEEIHPTPALLPDIPLDRAHARTMAMVVACDIHPLNNSHILKYLTGTLHASEDAKNAWYARWIALGLGTLETLAKEYGSTGKYCVGDAPGMADCCLIPQLYNARRFQCPLDAFPTLLSIEAHCNRLPAFDAAKPENQPDAVQ